MPMAGAKIEFVNTEGSDGGRSFTFLVANPCPYNVGGCVDGGRGGVRDLGYNLRVCVGLITCGNPMTLAVVVS